MKIYVSDKEIDDNNLNYVEDDWREEYWLSRGQSYGRGFEIGDDVGLVEIQSLEQHEAEIRKQERQKVIAELEIYKKAIDMAIKKTLTEKQYKEMRKEIKRTLKATSRR